MIDSSRRRPRGGVDLHALCVGLLAAPLVACPSPPPSSDAGNEGTGVITVGATDSGDATVDDTGTKLDLGGGGATMGPDPDDPTTDGCAEVTATLTPVVPTVWLLLDQSTSMDEEFGGVTRWEAMDDTLFDPETGIVTQLQSAVRFGMSLYTSDGGFDGGSCPILTEVEPALDNRDPMEAVFADQEPTGDTPTGESLEAIAMSLATFEAPPPDGPKIIVLATDGEPDTCAEPNPQNGQPESLAACALAYDLGLLVYVISVGDEIGADHLQEMANVGVGKAPDDPMPAPYYQALDPTELVAAFEAIIGGVIGCELAIDGIIELESACEGTVLLDGMPLECGVDWSVPEPSTLQLMGEACETLQDGEPHTVEGSWPCDVIMPIP